MSPSVLALKVGTISQELCPAKVIVSDLMKAVRQMLEAPSNVRGFHTARWSASLSNVLDHFLRSVVEVDN